MVRYPFETWKNVSGYGGDYQVSCHGRVRSRKFGNWRVLRACPNARGYLQVVLCQNNKTLNFTVHRLVVETFIGPRPKDYHILHRNGRQRNNRLYNLRWGTASENAWDKQKHGTTAKGRSHGMVKLSEEQVLEIRKLWDEGKLTSPQISVKFGIGTSQVKRIGGRRSWKHLRR